MSVQAAFAKIAREGGRAALVTALEGPHAGERLLVGVDGETEGTLGDAELDAEAVGHAEDLIWSDKSEHRGDLFVDVTAPPPRLVIFGAVEFATHLSALAKVAGWRAYVVDPRSRFATRERFPDAVDVVAGWPDDAFQKLGAIDPADLPRGAHARSEARRRGAAHGAAVGRQVHRRDGLQACAEGAPRAAHGARRHRRGARAHQRARSASTSAPRAPARRRCRSWPNASPSATDATAAGCARRAPTASESTPRPRAEPGRKRPDSRHSSMSSGVPKGLAAG